ncbi:response regulator [Oxalobacteraceae bacterium OM1]|nr:response regulator [Oxalobacteraceae bacterium OM1]
MRRWLPRTISGKLMLVVLATTFTALFAAGVGLVLYDLDSYRTSVANDLHTQAELIGRASAPALQFNDPDNAQANLKLLQVRPRIVAAAIYGANGRLFAMYNSETVSAQPGFPDHAQPEGVAIASDRITVFHAVRENNETIGTVYLRARYAVQERLANYLLILVSVLLASLLLAAVISRRLQEAITQPILAVTGVAREVMLRRDFSLRARRTSDDEVGVLVEAFNGMLDEVELRKRALEDTNRSLERETHERREAQEALLVADRRKDEFLATLAHELRNPLAPISSGLEIMRLTGAGSPASDKAREVMERQLRQMVRLVDDLIDVSRISTGKLVVRKEPVMLQDVARNAVEIVRSLYDSRGHELRIEMPEAPVWVEADFTRLSQVFSNLLNNSAKYTEPGGRVRFVMHTEDGQAVMEVADNGVGIPQDMLQRVFEMFTQVDRTLEGKQAGLGVGLTLAKRLVELHGGTIEARSAGINQGSTMVVRLAMNAAAAPEPAPRHDADVATRRRYRILVTDDNVDYAKSVGSLLESDGHEVRLAHDGIEALDVLRGFDPEFAFLDIGLPGLNGYDLARRLRQGLARDCVLVAVTGWGQEKDRRQAAEAGFDVHLVKPVPFERIRAILGAGAQRQPTSE